MRWYLGYNLDELLPDHSSLTRIRARYGLDVFRRFFEAIVEQCQQAGPVWGKERSFDATQVQADAAMDSLTARFAVEARQIRQAHQAREARGSEAAQAGWEAALAQPGEQQAVEAHLAALFPEAVLAAPAAEAAAMQLLDPSRLPVALPVARSATVRAELAATNAARHDWVAQAGRQQREVHGL